LGSSRLATDAKRALVRELGRFARAKRTRVVCIFDGGEPEHFGKQLGGVSVVFSGARSADDLIAARVATGGGWKVVTSDRALAGRGGGRRVEVVEPRGRGAGGGGLAAAEGRGGGEDGVRHLCGAERGR